MGKAGFVFHRAGLLFTQTRTACESMSGWVARPDLGDRSSVEHEATKSSLCSRLLCPAKMLVNQRGRTPVVKGRPILGASQDAQDKCLPDPIIKNRARHDSGAGRWRSRRVASPTLCTKSHELLNNGVR